MGSRGVYEYECDECGVAIPSGESVRIDNGRYFHTRTDCHTQYLNRTEGACVDADRPLYRPLQFMTHRVEFD